MNNRFNELMVQAVQLVAGEHTEGDVSRLNTDAYQVKNLINEKFAELIVKECVEAIRVMTVPTATSNPYAKCHLSGMVISQRLIKEHFGVE